MAIDQITGLPSSNVQTVYAGDKPISSSPSPAPVISATKIGTTAMTPVPTAPAPKDFSSNMAQIANYTGTSAETATSQEEQRLQAEADAKKASTQLMMTDYAQGQAALGGKAGDLATAYGTKDETGQSVNTLAAQLRQLNAQAQAIQLDTLAKGQAEINKATGQNITQQAVARNTADVTRENLINMATIGIKSAIAKADYDTAKSYADQVVDAKYSQMEANLKSKEIQLKWAMEQDLAPAQKKLADAQARQIEAQKQEMADKKELEKREYTEKINLRSEMEDVLLKAQQGNAPKNLIAAVVKGIDEGTLTKAKAIQMLGQYTGPIPASAQEYQYAVNQGYKGSFSQYQIEDANRKAVANRVSDSTVVAPEDTTKALGQLSFLKKTVESAEKLKEASGQSGLRTKAGDWFVGGTKYRQLENMNNTLKTNILTMMVDPAVKKFFGPQMTNQDVRLMTAGGTTLNVESQTPEQMQEELTRLKDLFQRAEDAVKKGMGEPTGQMSTQTNQTPAPQFEGYTLGADGKYYKNK